MKIMKIMFNPSNEVEAKLADEYTMNTIIISCGVIFPLFTYLGWM